MYSLIASIKKKGEGRGEIKNTSHSTVGLQSGMDKSSLFMISSIHTYVIVFEIHRSCWFSYITFSTVWNSNIISCYKNDYLLHRPQGVNHSQKEGGGDLPSNILFQCILEDDQLKQGRWSFIDKVHSNSYCRINHLLASASLHFIIEACCTPSEWLAMCFY